MAKKAYRAINKDTIVSLKASGLQFDAEVA